MAIRTCLKQIPNTNFVIGNWNKAPHSKAFIKINLKEATIKTIAEAFFTENGFTLEDYLYCKDAGLKYSVYSNDYEFSPTKKF